VVLLDLKYACYGWFKYENLNSISHKLKVIIVTSSISDETGKLVLSFVHGHINKPLRFRIKSILENI
jgi:hypothetical protein